MFDRWFASFVERKCSSSKWIARNFRRSYRGILFYFSHDDNNNHLFQIMIWKQILFFFFFLKISINFNFIFVSTFFCSCKKKKDSAVLPRLLSRCSEHVGLWRSNWLCGSQHGAGTCKTGAIINSYFAFVKNEKKSTKKKRVRNRQQHCNK